MVLYSVIDAFELLVVFFFIFLFFLHGIIGLSDVFDELDDGLKVEIIGAILYFFILWVSVIMLEETLE